MSLPNRPAPLSLLVVEDEPAIAFALADYLGIRGFHVDHAADLAAATSLLALHPYAALLTDLSLDGGGGQEGLDLAEAARQSHPEMRIIVLTAYGSPEAEVRAACLDLDAFLHKPTPLQEIARLIERLTSPPCETAARPGRPSGPSAAPPIPVDG